MSQFPIITDSWILVVILTAIRPLVAGAVTPFLGGELLQGPLRRTVILPLAILAVPRVAYEATAGVPESTLEIISLIAKEVFLGLCWGLAATKSYYAAMCVGALIDNQRGATIASVINPATSEESSLFGDMFQQVFVIAFFTSGGMHHYLRGFYTTYQIWPVLSYYPQISPALLEYFIGFLSSLASMTLCLAMPVVAAMFICEFGLGLISRFAQQLNVFFLAMPLKSLVALVVLTVYIGILMQALLQLPASPLDLFDVFQPELQQ